MIMNEKKDLFVATNSQDFVKVYINTRMLLRDAKQDLFIVTDSCPILVSSNPLNFDIYFEDKWYSAVNCFDVLASNNNYNLKQHYLKGRSHDLKEIKNAIEKLKQDFRKQFPEVYSTLKREPIAFIEYGNEKVVIYGNKKVVKKVVIKS